MSKSLKISFAAALVAASAFGGSAAFASGDYYSGARPDAVQGQKVDSMKTASIGAHGVIAQNEHLKDNGPARGDYYQGVDPNAR